MALRDAVKCAVCENAGEALPETVPPPAAPPTVAEGSAEGEGGALLRAVALPQSLSETRGESVAAAEPLPPPMRTLLRPPLLPLARAEAEAEEQCEGAGVREGEPLGRGERLREAEREGENEARGETVLQRDAVGQPPESVAGTVTLVEGRGEAEYVPVATVGVREARAEAVAEGEEVGEAEGRGVSEGCGESVLALLVLPQAPPLLPEPSGEALVLGGGVAEASAPLALGEGEGCWEGEAHSVTEGHEEAEGGGDAVREGSDEGVGWSVAGAVDVREAPLLALDAAEGAADALALEEVEREAEGQLLGDLVGRGEAEGEEEAEPMAPLAVGTPLDEAVAGSGVTLSMTAREGVGAAVVESSAPLTEAQGEAEPGAPALALGVEPPAGLALGCAVLVMGEGVLVSVLALEKEGCREDEGALLAVAAAAEGVPGAPPPAVGLAEEQPLALASSEGVGAAVGV